MRQEYFVSNIEEIDEPLKPFNEIYYPDSRNEIFVGSLEERHAYLENMTLKSDVPLEVKQLFETAKNLSLYSWFIYHFHQVSELIAFSALETALRMRYLKENASDGNEKKRPPTLYKLLQYAKNENWITNEGFPSLYVRAKNNARHDKSLMKLREHDFEKEPSMHVDEPTHEEVLEAISNLNMVEAITDNAHKIRNDLAHGASYLHPHSTMTLLTVLETINQIYSEEN